MSDLLIEIEFTKDLSYQCQLRQKLIEIIFSNQVGANLLPSSRKLASDLGISRNTITLVYQSLVDEGYLISQARKGFLVNPQIFQSEVFLKDRASKKSVTLDIEPDWGGRIVRHVTDLVSLSKDPNWLGYDYPFVYGQVNPNDFPIEQWRECNRWVQSKRGVKGWVEDSIDGDDEELIRQISQIILPARGFSVEPDEVLITLGTQNALFMLSYLLIDKSVSVGVEDPGYLDFKNIVKQAGGRLVPLPLDEQGVVIHDSLKSCDYVFVTPSHQYPTSVTMSLERRKALLEQSVQDDFFIFEDDYESEINFLSKPLPALKSMDKSGRVIYFGSLSKSISPGLRIGYVIANRDVIRELRATRRLNYRHPPTNNQRTAALFMSQGYFSSHVRRMKQLYEERWHLMRAGLQNHLSVCDITATPGSFCFWVRLPENVDSTELVALAAEESMFIESGDSFFMGGPKVGSYLRLGFSAINSDKIDTGLRLLGGILSECALKR